MRLAMVLCGVVTIGVPATVHADPDVAVAHEQPSGIGGGVRLQVGKAYVVRADVAWSPDARPIGLYLSANHIF